MDWLHRQVCYWVGESVRAKPCDQGQKGTSPGHSRERKKGRKGPAFVECLLLKHFHVQEGKTDLHICCVLGSVLHSLMYLASSGSPSRKNEPPYFFPVFFPLQQMCIFSTFSYFRPKAKEKAQNQRGSWDEQEGYPRKQTIIIQSIEKLFYKRSWRGFHA